MKTQQGAPVRARNIREKYYNPYIKEEARSDSKNTIRRGSQQQRKGKEERLPTDSSPWRFYELVQQHGPSEPEMAGTEDKEL
ncbi:hypothetical protein TNCV_4975631 [Trichonephila clavipes]|uniref:Uncharacterized protein n=1 Tax=Trichonephila clavipes TaxID=2585209 RepID=A0A8X6SSB2_TRICX|nr:hypothetical protein TNCV_4975631 [Trichonephila clavipes]